MAGRSAGLTTAAAPKARVALVAGSAAAVLCALLGASLLGVVARAGMPPPAAADGLACGLSETGREQIPSQLMPLYARAADEYGLGGRGVFVPAAINKVETDFGRNLGVSSAGAVGWMQFMPATWAAYGVDGDGDGNRDPNTPADAIQAAARYLRAGGAPGDWYRAIFAYTTPTGTSRMCRNSPTCIRAPARPTRRPTEEPRSRLAGGSGGRCRVRSHQHSDRVGVASTRASTSPRRAAHRSVPRPTGVVTFSGWAGGYGNYVCVMHSVRLTTCYAHLSRIDAPFGAQVATGNLLGAVGCTGHCFGDHLHFETRQGVDRSGKATDPAAFLR